MALTFSTGMTMDANANAETATNWAIARIAGAGQAPASSLSTGNQHVALWGLLSTITAIRTQSAGGFYILLQSSAETGTTAPNCL